MYSLISKGDSMRYLGLDLGTKTLGISMSDELGIIANSYKTIRYDNKDILIEDLKKVIDEYNVKVVVLGLPKNMNNSLGPRALETIEFSEVLKSELGIEIHLQDERLSTVSAHNLMIEANLSRKKRKTKVDSLAATIILQNFLDREGKKL